MKVVLVAGDFERGITIWGPFDSAGDAETFADKERFSCWEILKLYNPENWP